MRGLTPILAGIIVLSVHSVSVADPNNVRFPEIPDQTEPVEPEYSVMASSTAARLVESWEDILILDLRPHAAYERGHIKDAINVELKDEDFFGSVNKLDSSRPVLIYSDIDPPTEETYPVFKAAGFVDVVYLRDGYRGWKQNDLPTETGGMPHIFDSSARPIE